MTGERAKLLYRIAVEAVPQFWLAAMFLWTWIEPDRFGERMVHKLTFVMLLEFLVVHSTGFLSAIANRKDPRLMRGFMFGGLLLIYCLFTLAFSAMYGSLWPFFAFLVLTLSKIPAVVLRPPGDDGQFWAMANWAAMTAIYLGGIFLTAVADVPTLGVTPEVIARQEFGVGGLWPEEPYRVMAFGVFYFAGLGILAIVTELLGFRYGKAAEHEA